MTVHPSIDGAQGWRGVVGAPVRLKRTPVVVASRYRCPDHPDQPVTAKNAGCPLHGRKARTREDDTHQ